MGKHLAVYIGRFQPFHRGHLEIARHGLKIADELLIVTGSRNKARRTPRNPWTSEERERMILRALEADGVSHRVHIRPVFDVLNDDPAWFEQVQDVITDMTHVDIRLPVSGRDPEPKVTLIGYSKDASSYYLQTFPGITYSPVAVPQNLLNLNATDIRRYMLEGTKNLAGDLLWPNLVPDGTREYLQDWLRTHDLPKEG